VVLATPPDWSARIGIFGKWGDGKSTVLRFAEQMLKQKKSLVFWFNPWAIQNWNDLWEAFGGRLSGALSEAGIPVDSTWLKMAKDSTKWLESTGIDQIAKAGAAVLGKDKVADAAFGLVSRWLRYDGPQIRAIQKKVKQRRLVVLIDDLDRTAPGFLPQLLLSLRELLDLPGFTFLLAFDDEILARALADNNPAWLDGSNFLEKILDFRFHLPPITEKQKARLVSSSMAKYCPFVPQESVKEILDLLPNNPRKLKTLIRSLAALKPQIARHDPDELNWVDMWLVQMLRLESYPFFEKILSGNALDRETGMLYRLLHAGPHSGREREGEGKNESLKRLIKDSGVEVPAVVQRLVHLIKAIRSRSSFRFRYLCELAIRPHAVTWREFRSLYAMWTADPRAAVLGEWIAQHAVDRAVNAEDVEIELFETILVKRSECLSAAADSSLIQEQGSHSSEAGVLLLLIEQYLVDLNKFEASRFRALFDQVTGWIAFRKNPADAALRAQESTLLIKLLSSASAALSPELLEVISPQSPFPDIGEGVAEKKDLRRKCIDVIAPRAAREALTFLAREGGIRSLTEQGRFPAIKYCLFRPQSPIWKTSLRDDLLELIGRGREDSSVYENVCGYFDLLAQGLDRNLDWVRREDVATVLTDDKFVASLWKTIISRAIQYRMLITFIRGRRALVLNGVSEGLLPLTDEMQSRLKEEEAQSGPETAVGPEGTNNLHEGS
jgi:KAP-like P-loop domain-containing protein